MARIAIVTRPDYRSPRILAESLKLQLEKSGANADVFYSVSAFTRLYPDTLSENKIRFHFWLRKKLKFLFPDYKFLKKLKTYDAIIVSECCPNAFWKEYYQIEQLRRRLGKPVLFYEVYFLGNAPSQLASLRADGHPLIERYDWHLAVSEVTEIRSSTQQPWSCVGLDLTASNLKPSVKDEFVALVDFSQFGYEEYQNEQIRVLEELNIKTIVLKGNYSLSEIRELYKNASVFFIQSPEAFCLPIAECLSCGVQVFTANSGWPMSWRLDENPEIHGEGLLPDIFSTYNSSDHLKKLLIDFRNSYDLQRTPFKIFDTFIHTYPHFYYGVPVEIQKLLIRIKTGNFS
jgi:hypothetical protein